MMHFGASIALGLTPLLVFGATAMLRPVAVPKLVVTEGVTARRMDDSTFRLRWPVDLPPATTIRETPSAEAAVSPPRQFPGRQFAQPRPVVVKRAGLRTDVCTRHGMKRVEYLKRGYKHWRCRR